MLQPYGLCQGFHDDSVFFKFFPIVPRREEQLILHFLHLPDPVKRSCSPITRLKQKTWLKTHSITAEPENLSNSPLNMDIFSSI